MKSDGSKMDIKTFMNDAQASMNETYRKMFGISAPLSDMNLVSSAHQEAFSTTKSTRQKCRFYHAGHR